MSWWDAWWLGLVQGLTEFLPVSSSGHLVLTQAALGLNIPGVLVEVTLHLATLIAVVVVYRRALWRLVEGAVRLDRAAWSMIGLLGLASVPAAAVGLFFKDAVEGAFDSLLFVGLNLIVTGIVLRTTTRVPPPTDQRLGWWGAFRVGVAQAFAILPGISRSGSTIAAALWLRVAPERAAEFSFLMAIPIIAGAGAVQLRGADWAASPVALGPLAFAFAAALVSGVVAIKLLVAVMVRQRLHRFAPYCWLVGAVTVGLALWT